MGKYIKREDVLTVLTYNGLDDLPEIISLLLAMARKKVRYIPGVDVVPKSEIEMLQGALKAEEQHNELTMEMAQKALKNAKAEVAREIFEEIKARSMYDFPKMYYTISRMALDELEIKYTEGEDEKGSN